jgi:membrane-associated phospholipid phosphatase
MSAMIAENHNQLQPRPFLQHIGIGIAMLVVGIGLAFFDIAIISQVNSDNWPGDLRRIVKLSEIFAHGFGVALIVLAIWNLNPDRRRHLVRLISCAAFPPITAHLIKLFVPRNRPTSYFDHLLQPTWPDSNWQTWLVQVQEATWNVEYQTQSFPSAHSALVCGLAIGLSFLYPRGRVLFLCVAILASIQRVIFFAHWPSDVAVGCALGFLIAGGLVQNWGIGYLCGRLEANREKPVA